MADVLTRRITCNRYLFTHFAFCTVRWVQQRRLTCWVVIQMQRRRLYGYVAPLTSCFIGFMMKTMLCEMMVIIVIQCAQVCFTRESVTCCSVLLPSSELSILRISHVVFSRFNKFLLTDLLNRAVALAGGRFGSRQTTLGAHSSR